MTVVLPNVAHFGTPWDVDTAIGWLTEQVTGRTTGWHNVCLGITAKAYGYAASGTVPAERGRSGWAIEAWDQAPVASKHPGVFDNAPRGAIFHWRKRWGKGPGHTATCDGAGRIFTNDLRIDGRITLEPIDDVRLKWGMVMVGWRAPQFIHGTGRNPDHPTPLPPPRVPVMPIVVLADLHGRDSSVSAKLVNDALVAEGLLPKLLARAYWSPAAQLAMRRYRALHKLEGRSSYVTLGRKHGFAVA